MVERREGYYLDLVRRIGSQYDGYEFINSELALNLVFTYDVMHQCTARYMAEVGLSKSTFQLLMLLRHGPPEGMQLHDLGEMLLVSRANVTGLIDHLEEKGFVTRAVNEQDRRGRYAKATPKAEALLDQFVPRHFNNVRSLMSDLSSSEKRQLTALLTKVRQSIRNNAAVCERPLAERL